MPSWIETANAPDGDFPLQNLPYGVYSRGEGPRRCCVAIGDRVLDLAALEAAGVLDASGDGPVFDRPALNAFMALGPAAWAAVRARLTSLLRRDGDPALRESLDLKGKALVAMADADLHLPFQVADYTDFYSAKQHAFNVGVMFRGPENALPANYLHIPIGYNGRASSVVVSGTDFRRPLGQLKAPEADAPHFGPSQRFDFELELGAVVGTPSTFGQPVSVAEADAMIFGFVLLNDWSARDIQAWEYVPLGPFQAKATATTISPWVVPRAALEPFRTVAPEREKPLLPYLDDPAPRHYDIVLEAALTPEGSAETGLSRTNAKYLYYSAAQQLAHHTSSGCPMRTGDLLGSGTISGPDKSEWGSLLELSWGGQEPFPLADGSRRSFLQDGDTLTLRGWCQGDGYRIGFGECSGKLLPALTV
ncbi:MAG: fumarylacetoacetase [Alphaproteobacteria bacterium]|nr:fumarylacetoacetase [Alphaproteobacteria bacterium]MCB9931484.1 fumarylacetoacetase [Alphaproteobacteria bacterium]